mmetsp:Transcript_125047/g.233925  ORF Transcript_125047/g.233925 Transcript_125047/m.233925 type:complete len:210 (-) Transcript_125047:282-911(-)
MLPLPVYELAFDVFTLILAGFELPRILVNAKPERLNPSFQLCDLLLILGNQLLENFRLPSQQFINASASICCLPLNCSAHTFHVFRTLAFETLQLINYGINFLQRLREVILVFQKTFPQLRINLVTTVNTPLSIAAGAHWLLACLTPCLELILRMHFANTDFSLFLLLHLTCYGLGIKLGTGCRHLLYELLFIAHHSPNRQSCTQAVSL